MAKAESTNIPAPSPRRRGGLPVETSGYRGLLIIKKRKERKGPKKTELQQAWVNNFSCLARWSKFADPRARNYAEEMAPDTGWYWRDIIESAMSGKLIRKEGEHPITTPTANVFRDTSESLTQNITKTLTPNDLTWDNNYFWNPTANQSRLTVRSPGLYLVGCTLLFSGASTARRDARIEDNNGNLIAENGGGEGTSSGGYRSVMGIWYFHKDDYALCRAFTSGTGQSAQIIRFWILAITPEQLLPSP